MPAATAGGEGGVNGETICMVEFTAFRLSRIVVVALGAAAVAALITPASSEPLHHSHAYVPPHGHEAAGGYVSDAAHAPRRLRGRAARAMRQQASAPAHGFGFGAGYNQPAYEASAMQPSPRRSHRRHARRLAPQPAEAQWQSAGLSGGSSSLVAEARRHIGGNPTGRSSLWCARFMNMVLQRAGHRGTGSDMARSFASYGQRISGPQVGAIAVMSRGKHGGHVGVVSGIDAKGNPIVVSGNHSRRVAESVYPRSRVYAYVMPSS